MNDAVYGRSNGEDFLARQLRHRINVATQSITELVGLGVPQNYDAYREQVGTLAGLRMALSFLQEVVAQMNGTAAAAPKTERLYES